MSTAVDLTLTKVQSKFSSMHVHVHAHAILGGLVEATKHRGGAGSCHSGTPVMLLPYPDSKPLLYTEGCSSGERNLPSETHRTKTCCTITVRHLDWTQLTYEALFPVHCVQQESTLTTVDVTEHLQTTPDEIVWEAPRMRMARLVSIHVLSAELTLFNVPVLASVVRTCAKRAKRNTRAPFVFAMNFSHRSKELPKVPVWAP